MNHTQPITLSPMPIKYLTVKEVAFKLGVAQSRVIALCRQGRITGVTKFGQALAIPENFAISEGTRGPKFQKINKNAGQKKQ